MILKKGIKSVIRRMRRGNIFMLHHVIDECESVELKSSRVLSLLNFLKLCNKYQFSDIRYCQKGDFLTFDDGLSDFYYVVYPIISQRKIPVILFVNVSFLDQPGYITTKQLIEISKSPYVTIGSHCVNHISLKMLSNKDKKFEIVESKKQLENIICKNVDYIAYPFGQYDKTVLKILSKSGYEKGFSAAEFEVHSLKYRKFCLPRIDITDKRIIQWI